MKKLYIILDGLGDRPVKQLSGKTPLEAATTLHLNYLAGKSEVGLMRAIPRVAPESDEAMLALLGFDPYKYHKGRGPLEAFGAGVKFGESDVVLRCNFAKVFRNKITDTEAEISNKEIKQLEAIKLSEVRFRHTIGHRGVLILSGSVSDKVSNTNPTYKIVRNYVTTALSKTGKLVLKKCLPLDKTKQARKSAELVNKFISEAEKILKNKTVLTRGAGQGLPKLPRLAGRWALLADMPVEKAIGKLCGMTVLGKEQDYKKLARQALEALEDYDNIYFEIKGPDSFAHHGDFRGKQKIIEQIDKEFFGTLVEGENLDEVVICVTADHATSSELRAHTADAVPVILHRPYSPGGGLIKFSEKSCKRGSLGLLSGQELFKLLIMA
jgi:2,3-bisphosphoglycerate-independent phosphoglycerate mutase